MYNLTLLMNSSNPGVMATSANEASGGYLISLFLVALFIVMMVGLLRYGFLKSIASSAFAMFFLSLIAAAAEWINPLLCLGFFIVMAGAALLLYLTE